MAESNNIIKTNADQAGDSQPANLFATSGMLFNPPIDIYETDDGLVLYADLPGVNSDGLDLQVQDNRLSLFGRVKPQAASQNVVHEEYKVGDFLRSFILSDDVDHEHITARLNNGVLRVELPRTARSEPRRIEVSSE